MISDLDIWRSASVLIEKHGDEARGRADAMIERALNDNARAVWVRIRDAIDELQNETPGVVH